MIQSHHFRPRCPPLSELTRKPRAPVISESDDQDQDDTVPPLNAFEGFTTSTPVLKGGFFPEFFSGTSLNLPSPIQTEPINSDTSWFRLLSKL